jgi:hypothetical protein
VFGTPEQHFRGGNAFQFGVMGAAKIHNGWNAAPIIARENITQHQRPGHERDN